MNENPLPPAEKLDGATPAAMSEAFNAAARAGATLFQYARRGAYNDKRGPRFEAALALAMITVRTREVQVLTTLLLETWAHLRELDVGFKHDADYLHRAMELSFNAALEDLKTSPPILSVPGRDG